tara:strand:+ start:23999 stop:25468 length:1470 start_codon:yes stop_codon:yes gene_type:complete
MSNLDNLMKDHYSEKDVFGLNSLVGLIEEVMEDNKELFETLADDFGSLMSGDLIAESRREAEKFVMTMPKFVPTENWGDPKTADRKAVQRLFSNIKGGTIEARIAFLKRIQEENTKIVSPRRIISSLILLETLAMAVNNFSESAAGFVFEAFLAALLGGKQEAEVSAEKGNLPIEDIVAFSEFEGVPSVPVSLKLLSKKGGGKAGTGIHGSYTNLVDGVNDWVAVRYIVALKEFATVQPGSSEEAGGKAIGSKLGVETIDLYEFAFTQDNFLSVLGVNPGNLKNVLPIELKADSSEAKQYLASLSELPWPELYRRLQDGRAYTNTAAKQQEEPLEVEPEEPPAEAPEEPLAEGMKTVTVEQLKGLWTEELLLESSKVKTQWVITQTQLMGGTRTAGIPAMDSAGYREHGNIGISTSSIVAAAQMHISKLSEGIKLLFTATKMLGEDVDQFFTTSKRSAAHNAGLRAVDHAEEISTIMKTQAEIASGETE